jgi:Molybdopterin-binding domain of aldehyde dehydrogenase
MESRTPRTRRFVLLWAAFCAAASHTLACCEPSESMLARTTNLQSRRDFLKSGGALIVSFSAASLTVPSMSAQGQFDTHSSHIDPKRLDSWLAVGADGTITAYTGKCDFGQGIFTTQTQLVAEELCVPVSRVKLIQCDTALTPDQGTTSGSQSTPTNFNSENLALAAATCPGSSSEAGCGEVGWVNRPPDRSRGSNYRCNGSPRHI